MTHFFTFDCTSANLAQTILFVCSSLCRSQDITLIFFKRLAGQSQQFYTKFCSSRILIVPYQIFSSFGISYWSKYNFQFCIKMRLYLVNCVKQTKPLQITLFIFFLIDFSNNRSLVFE